MTTPLELTTLASIVSGTGGTIQTGPFGSQLHASDYQPTGTPLVMPVNLGDNEIREGGIARIGAADTHRLQRHALRIGDIVFSRRGDVGRRSLVRETAAGWLCGTGCLAARFGPDKSKVNPAYVAEYLGSNAAQVWLADNAVGGTMPNLNTSILGALPIVLPPKSEQDSIVEAFGDFQNSVRSLERLIAKKEAIKQGMMQQLLTGRTRLPGFTKRWPEKTVGSIGVVTMGHSPAGSTYNSNGQGVPLIQGNADIRGRATFDRIWTVAPTTLCEAGGVILTVRAPVGHTATATNQSCIGRGVCAISTEGDDRFLFHALVYAEPKWKLYEQGSIFTAVNSAQIRSFTLLWPSDSAERAAIASILDDSDMELRTLGDRLTKAREIKTGMMQQLLTGRSRLPPVSAS